MSIILSLSALISIVAVSFIVGLLAGIAIMAYCLFNKDRNERTEQEVPSSKDSEHSEL